jgi:Fungal fucose-specific lectin
LTNGTNWGKLSALADVIRQCSLGGDARLAKFYVGGAGSRPNLRNLMIQEMVRRSVLSQKSLLPYLLAVLACFPGSQAHSQDQVHELSFNGSTWTDQALPSDPTFGHWSVQMLAFSTSPNNQRHLFYSDSIGPDVHQLFYNGLSWSDENLTAPFDNEAWEDAGTQFAGFAVGNYQYVYYTCAYENICQLVYDNANWTPTALGGDPGEGLTAFTTSPAIHTFYADFRGFDLHQMYTTDGTNWQDQDLTELTHGMTYGGGNFQGFNIDNLQYVFFLGSDGHVHQYSYNNSGWSDEDLTLLAKSPAAPGYNNVTACLIPGTKKMRVYYIANNGHLIQLAATNSAKWSSADLTKKTSGPLPDADAAMLAFGTSDKKVHVFYESGNHVNQISQLTATTWSNEDLTVLTNGGFADTGTAITGFGLQDSLYIYYAAVSQ